MPRATDGDHAALTSAAGVHGFHPGEGGPRARRARLAGLRAATPVSGEAARASSCSSTGMPGRPAAFPSHTGGVHRYGWTPTPRKPASASSHRTRSRRGAVIPRPGRFCRQVDAPPMLDEMARMVCRWTGRSARCSAWSRSQGTWTHQSFDYALCLLARLLSSVHRS